MFVQTWSVFLFQEGKTNNEEEEGKTEEKKWKIISIFL